jgi:hypothetical protein
MYRSGFGHWGVPQPFYDEGGGGGGGGDNKDVITFKNNDELEALVKGRVDSAVALAVKKAGGGTSDADKAELDKLRKEQADRERAAQEAKGNYEAALKSQEKSIRDEYEPKVTAEKTRADTAHGELEKRVIGLAVSDAAGKLNAVNPAQVRQLIAGSLKMDDHYEAVVVDEEGKPRFVAGKAMTVEQLVKEFLDANPHLVRSSAGDGGGAGGEKDKGGDASAIAQQEAVIKKLEEDYQRTHDLKLVTKLRVESAKLTELKKKAS